MAKKSTTKSTRKTATKSTRKAGGKTPARKRPAKSAAKTVSAQPDDPAYRVYKWDAALRNGLKEKRESQDMTQRAFIKSAVAEYLPKVVEGLALLGVSVEDRASEGPVRVPVEASTLAALRSASNWSDLPQNLLMQACLRLSVREQEKPTRRRSSKK